MSDSNNLKRFADPTYWHSAANIYPLMSGAEIDELAADIEKNRLHNPICSFS